MFTFSPKNPTPSARRCMRCSKPCSPASRILPPAPTMRCHGNPALSRVQCPRHLPRRARIPRRVRDVAISRNSAARHAPHLPQHVGEHAGLLVAFPASACVVHFFRPALFLSPVARFVGQQCGGHNRLLCRAPRDLLETRMNKGRHHSRPIQTPPAVSPSTPLG